MRFQLPFRPRDGDEYPQRPSQRPPQRPKTSGVDRPALRAHSKLSDDAAAGPRSFDPAVPKIVSISRRTLHPSAMDPCLDVDLWHSMRSKTTGLDHSAAIAAARTRRTNSGNRATFPPQSLQYIPYRGLLVEDEGETDGEAAVPTSRFNKKGAAAAAHDAAMRTTEAAAVAAAVARRGSTRRAPAKPTSTSASTSTPTSASAPSSDLDHDANPHDIVPNLDRPGRHEANKRLYKKMKAENHNLWVLLDASNRRADAMVRTLQAEEQRCVTLEQRAARLETALGGQSLGQPQGHSQSNSAPLQSPQAYELPSPDQEYADAASELARIRQNLAQSRNTVRDMRRDVAAIPVVAELPADVVVPPRRTPAISPASLTRTITEMLGSASPLASESVDPALTLVRPTPVRPQEQEAEQAEPEESTSDSDSTDPDTSSSSSYTRASSDAGTSSSRTSSDASSLSDDADRANKFERTPEPVLLSSARYQNELRRSPSPEALDIATALPPTPPQKSVRRDFSLTHIHPALREKARQEMEQATGDAVVM